MIIRCKPLTVVAGIIFSLNSLSNAIANSFSHHNPILKLKILGINDFHGQISSGRFEKNEPVGGAAVLAAYLKNAQRGMEDETIIAITGDHVGASPPASALLHDEPTILFTNSLGNTHCSPTYRMNPKCNIVATIGNHEFDQGQQALFDLIYGTNHPPTNNWYPLINYPGAAYPYVSANIINSESQKPLFPPYTIKLIHGVRIAFIGAILKNAASTMFPAHAKGLTFSDEAEAINHYIPEIKKQGADLIIVLIHEGGQQKPYEGPTQANTQATGAITDIVYQLDEGIDVVMAGHTHQFLNTYLPNHHGSPVLVTQANSYSTSFTELNIDLDRQTHQVLKKYAQIITTFANRGPGTLPDAASQNIVNLAEQAVAPIINEYVGTTHTVLSRNQNKDGESNLGNLITDALKIIMQADMAIINPHGLRADISEGVINKGAIYATMPFANTIITVSLTGQDLYDLLEQQWLGPYANMLQISGLNYIYDSEQSIGKKIISISLKQQPIKRDKNYLVATTDFLASGSGVFTVMKRSKMIRVGDSDQEVVMHYIKNLAQPFISTIEGRIKDLRND